MCGGKGLNHPVFCVFVFFFFNFRGNLKQSAISSPVVAPKAQFTAQQPSDQHEEKEIIISK